MNAITVVILIFSMLGALDRIFGNKFALGAEFERGFQLFGAMALSMIVGKLVAGVASVVLAMFLYKGDKEDKKDTNTTEEIAEIKEG